MFENKKVIIFDMDGTLIDSIGIWNKVDKNLIKKFGYLDEISEFEIQERRDRLLREYSKFENPYIEYCKELGKKYNSKLNGEEILKLRYEISQDYLKNIVDYKLDADRFIKKLKERNFILVIATTTRRKNMEIYRTQNKNIISRANIDDYFKIVLTRDDVKKIKPNPEVYLKILEILKLKKEECLIFEDSLIGIESAKNAGIEVVSIYDKYSDEDREKINKIADYSFNNYNEVIRILEDKL